MRSAIRFALAAVALIACQVNLPSPQHPEQTGQTRGFTGGGFIPGPGLTEVRHDGTLTGKGTPASPLADSGVAPATTTVQNFRGTVLRPAAITGAVDDWAPGSLSTATTIIVGTSGTTTLSGITGGADGRQLELCNSGVFKLTLANDATSTPTNRFMLAGAQDWDLGSSGHSCARFTYDSSAARWKMTSKTGTTMPALTVTGAFALPGVQNDTSTGTVDDFASTATTTELRWNGASAATIDGLTNGADGRVLVIANIATVAGTTLTLANEAAGSAPANRMTLANGVAFVIAPGASKTLRYDLASLRWRPVDTANANLLSQQFTNTGSTTLSGVQTDTSTGTLNDFALSATATTLRWNGAGTANLNGMTGGAEGRIVIIESISASGLTINPDNGGSTAANRFYTMQGSTISLTGSTTGAVSITFKYDATASRWREIARSNNNWAMNNNFSAGLLLSGTISPTALSGSTNDYAPTSLTNSTTVRQDVSAAATLTGLASGASGRLITFTNIATTAGLTLTVTNEDALSTAANRFTLLNGQPLVLNPGGSFTFRYDATSSRWRPFSQLAGSQLVAQADTSTGTQNDFVINNDTQVLRATPASNVTFNGFKCGLADCTAANGGRRLTIENLGTSGAVILSNEIAGSVAGNRITTVGAANYTLSANQNANIDLVYDGSALRWRPVVGSNTVGASTTFAATLTASAQIRHAGESETTETGTSNSYDVGSSTYAKTWNGASSLIVNGLAGAAQGREIDICNISATTTISFTNESGSASAAERIRTPLGAGVTLNQYECALARYSGVDSRWYLRRTSTNGTNDYAGTHFEWGEEFMVNFPAQTDAFQQTVTGAGATATLITSGAGGAGARLGIAQAQTGTTTTGSYERRSSASLYTGDWTSTIYRFTGGVPTISTAAEAISVIAGTWIADNTITQASGCFFVSDRENTMPGNINAGNASKWEAVCGNGGTRTAVLLDGTTQGGIPTVNSPIAAVTFPNTNFDTLEVTINGTTSATFAINGTVRATITTNLPATNVPTWAGFQILKSAGTTTRFVYVDRHKLEVNIPTPRSP